MAAEGSELGEEGSVMTYVFSVIVQVTVWACKGSIGDADEARSLVLAVVDAVSLDDGTTDGFTNFEGALKLDGFEVGALIVY